MSQKPEDKRARIAELQEELREFQEELRDAEAEFESLT